MGYVTDGLVLDLEAARANGGAGPGLNSPFTTPIKDLTGLGHDGTLTGFTTSSFGDMIAETGTTLTNLADVKAGSKFTCVLTCAATSLGARLGNTGTGHAACNVKGLIYADSGGAPGALVAATYALAIADNEAATRKTLTFANAVNLTPGNYWLCVIGDATATGLIFYSAATGGNSAKNADTYSDGPSDPFGTPTTGTLNCAINANVTNDPQAASGYAGAGTTADPYRLVLDGNNDYVAVPAVHACDDKVFSHEAWFMYSGAPSALGCLIAEANAANAYTYPNARIYIDTDGKAYFQAKDASNSAITLASPASVCNGAWHHIVATADGTYARLYVDGVLTDGPTTLPAGSMTTGWTTVGALRYGTTPSITYYLSGGVAVARIYDRTLSDAEVAANRAAGYVLAPRGGGRSPLLSRGMRV